MMNKKAKIVLVAASILIGIFISILMKENIEYYTPVTLSSIQNTKDEIKSINNEIEQLRELIDEKEEELEIIDNIFQNEENIIDKLLEDKKYNKSKSGYTQVEGPGISIKMFDNPEDWVVGWDINDDIIHDVDILNILNDLRVAGAEAISVNGERVLANSEIKCRGPVVRINGKTFGTPFIIEAIGDPKILMASVNAPGTYGETLKSVYDIGFEPEVKDKISILGYSGNFNFKYAKPKGEGDI